jgi:hypothetical protein
MHWLCLLDLLAYHLAERSHLLNRDAVDATR